MMDFNPDYVLAHYLHQENGVEYIYYPASAPKRLLVTFAALNEGGHFQRIRQFWSVNETWTDTAFMFFRDKTNGWYSEPEPIVEAIRGLARSIDVSRVVTSGSCMGAYGALLVGLRLPAFAMLLTTTRFFRDTVPEQLVKTFEECPTLPRAYLEARGLWPDQEALQYLMERYRVQGGLCLFRSMPESKEHWAINLWNVPFTLNLLDTLEAWKD